MLSKKAFPFFSFSGTPREIGRQYGQACAELIKENIARSFERLVAQSSISSREQLENVLQRFRASVLKHTPFFDEEIVGVAEGAAVSVMDAYLLQLRAEAYYSYEPNDECTSFAVLPEATSDGVSFIGQNADLPVYFDGLGIVMECKPQDGPAYLMVTPAGLISYVGMNNLGVGVATNFLATNGWRYGVPRYFFTRLALSGSRVEEGVAAIRNVYRASSRNIMILDSYGKAVSMEITPTEDTLIEPKQGLIVHANHFIGEKLLREEQSTGAKLENSRARRERLHQLLMDNHGQLHVTLMQSLLQDRAGEPNCLCVNHGDNDDWYTFASIISVPSKGEMWVSAGPPNQNTYTRYSFTS